MGGSFSKDILEKVTQCKGAMPWENILSSECGARLTTLQRGGTNVHYPSLKSSILIPPHSSQNLKTKIAETLSWQFFDSQQDGVDVSVIISPIAKELEQPEDKIREIIAEMIEGSSDKSNEDSKSEEEYRHEEYLAFLGEYDKKHNDAHDFLTELRPSTRYEIPLLESVVLVKKLRELRVQTGFSRIKPPQLGEETENSSEEKIETMPVSQRRQKWLPGYEVRGEGIFLEFNKYELNKWANKANVKTHLAPLISRSNKSPDAIS
jgi:hypothetical protein